jgi:acrylyl-CoA reductase (NADPH)
MSIQALVTTNTGSAASSVQALEPDALGEGDVTVAVEWSTINYKDGLALAGAGIMASYPMVGGIDLAGVVETSEDPAFKPGDRVLINGWGLSQTHNGGYAQKARVLGA